MNRDQVLDLIDKNICFEDLNKASKLLQKNYEINQTRMEAEDVRMSLRKGYPVAIKDKLIIGYSDLKKAFETSDDDFIQIERPVEAIEIVEPLPEREHFAIVGQNEWGNISEFVTIIGNLRLGEIFLPKHSAIFNFLNPTDQTKKEKIQSVLNGVQINIYEHEKYVDNCLHEIGHLFWRTCTRFEEKMQFKELHKYLKQSCIYEYEWERKDAEEVFCTVYKWYMKSVLMNKSFYNILEYEEPQGLKILQQVFDRIAKERIIDDIWEMSKEDVLEYLNPPLDRTSGKYIRKSGMLDKIKDIELPESVLNNIESVQDGQIYIGLGKACVPVRNGLIDFDRLKMKPLEKAENKKVILLDMDGVVTNFSEAYKQAFNRDVFKDDAFTVQQFCLSQPRFFRTIPVLERGKELYNRLAKKYNVIFLTTPMEGMSYCKADKLAWLKDNICKEPTIIFSDNKADYAHSEKDILIDDMDHNLTAFYEAGGTAINFLAMSNDEIMQKIAETLNPQQIINEVKSQLKSMQVNTEPSERQKETGNYKKGQIVFKQIPITIENPKGSVRYGIGANGVKWLSKMYSHYGYIKGTEGNDFDEIDCYIGDDLGSTKVFVINQGFDNLFDESKVMLGYSDINSAKQAFLRCYEKGWEKNIMSIGVTNTKRFREWLKSGVKTEPFVGDK